MRRSKVSQLPQDLRDALNARLIGDGFANYDAIVEWLAEQGFVISRSSLHRHGSDLKEQIEESMADARRTRALARAAREAGDADDGELLELASGIMQDSLLRTSLQLKRAGTDDPIETAKTLSLLSRAFADVGRFDLARQKWQSEVRARAEAAATSAEKIARKGGLSAESVAALRREILGIAA
ncbi:MAG: DUF3486 family protein [Zoogloeaceae bacterium]|jgi:hypothetical protein|nr:DUF3486 family protein [Zoogloeaceae bacterium]